MKVYPVMFQRNAQSGTPTRLHPRLDSGLARSAAGIMFGLILIVAHPAWGNFNSIQNAVQHASDIKQAGITPRPGARLPLNLTFTNSHGKLIRLGDYFHKGRPVILDFVYFRCPGVCNFVQLGLVHTLNKLAAHIGSDYDVVTVSFDPTDTPRAARKKKAGYLAASTDPSGLKKHWHFLVGTQANIKALTSAVGFRYVYYPILGQYNHAACIYVCTPGGRMSNYFFGIKYNPANVNLALVQAGDHRITNIFDQILLLCCQFNPNTGKYTPIALRVMTLGGVAVLVGLASLFGTLFYWEHKHRGSNSTGAKS